MKYGRFITINLSEPSDFSHTKKIVLENWGSFISYLVK